MNARVSKSLSRNRPTRGVRSRRTVTLIYRPATVEEFARPFVMALAVVGAIVVVSMILYWRRKEQELAAAAERDIPGPLQAEQSGEADG